MRKEILLNIEIITLVIDSKNKRIKLNKVIGYLKKVMTTIFFFTVVLLEDMDVGLSIFEIK